MVLLPKFPMYKYFRSLLSKFQYLMKICAPTKYIFSWFNINKFETTMFSVKKYLTSG
jgi:hypothetical protein